MTIKDTVKQAVSRIKGNHLIKLVTVIYYTDPINLETPFTENQVKRALRDLKHVKRVNGRYIVKGRRVPAKAS